MLIVIAALLAALPAAVFLLVEPATTDLAAQTFRADLWDRDGFVIWNPYWYGGHPVPGYSLLYPPLGAWIGPHLVGALSAVGAATAFAAIARDSVGEQRARLGAWWFALAAGAWLFTGRVTFLLGIALGLAALLAVLRDRRAAAALLAGLCAAASPVSGLFLGIAAVAMLLSGDRERGLILGVGAGTVLVAMIAAFPTGGIEPFELSAFAGLAAFVVLFLALVDRARAPAAWTGVAIYGLGAIAVLLIDNPLGGNVTRLGALLAGPAVALLLWPDRRKALALAAVPLLYWQLVAPVRDSITADQSYAAEAFHDPLLAQLDRRAGTDPVRIHIPPSQTRWEAARIAPHYPLARGWLRQAESDDFDLFRDGELTASDHRAWLADRAVSWVAVPRGVERDYLAQDEVRLILDGVSYLREVWRSADWLLYRVKRSPGDPKLAGNGSRLVALGPDRWVLEVPGPGTYPVRVGWTPYFEFERGAGCLERAGDWVKLYSERAGEVEIRARLSPHAVLGRDESCSE